MKEQGIIVYIAVDDDLVLTNQGSVVRLAAGLNQMIRTVAPQAAVETMFAVSDGDIPLPTLAALKRAVGNASESHRPTTDVAEEKRQLLRAPLDVVIDADGCAVFLNGCDVRLTRRESDVFWYLHQASPDVRSRQEILDDLWSDCNHPQPQAVNTYARRIRLKLGPAAQLLQSVRGRGYRIRSNANAVIKRTRLRNFEYTAT